MSRKGQQKAAKRREEARQAHATLPTAPDPALIISFTPPEISTLREAEADHLQKPEGHNVVARNEMCAHGLRRGLFDALKADQTVRAKVQPSK